MIYIVRQVTINNTNNIPIAAATVKHDHRIKIAPPSISTIS